jgi:hypothetical protein
MDAGTPPTDSPAQVSNAYLPGNIYPPRCPPVVRPAAPAPIEGIVPAVAKPFFHSVSLMILSFVSSPAQRAAAETTFASRLLQRRCGRPHYEREGSAAVHRPGAGLPRLGPERSLIRYHEHHLLSTDTAHEPTDPQTAARDRRTIASAPAAHPLAPCDSGYSAGER